MVLSRAVSNTKGLNLDRDKDLYQFLRNIFDMPNPFGEQEEYTWEDILSKLATYKIWITTLITDFSIKKQYTDEHIAEHIFCNHNISKTICKYHIVAIKQCIKDLEDELLASKKQNIPATEKYIKGKLALLKDIVLDTYELIGQCEEVFLQKTATLKLGRRRIFASNEIYNNSKNLLRRHFYYNDITFSSISVFLIRQSIETKVLNSLGIYSIVDENDEAVKFKLESIVEFINQNENIKFPIKKSILLKITKWTNYYIHRGIMHYHWQIIWAHKVLQPLFSMGVGETKIHLYGAVKINKDYFDNKLEAELLKYLNITEAKINKCNPEALIE